MKHCRVLFYNELAPAVYGIQVSFFNPFKNYSRLAASAKTATTAAHVPRIIESGKPAAYALQEPATDKAKIKYRILGHLAVFIKFNVVGIIFFEVFKAEITLSVVTNSA